MEEYIDLTGYRSGFLEALHPISDTQNANTLWVCYCHNCGSEVPVKRSHLARETQPQVKSCGCLAGNPERGGTNLNRLLTKNPAVNSKTGIPGVSKDACGYGYRARADYYGVRYEMRGFDSIEVAAIIRKSMQIELVSNGTIDHTRELARFYKETF